MKRISIILMCLCLAAASLGAQDVNRFVSRYNNIVSRVGYNGIGVDALLTQWEKSDSTDINLLLARFNYWFAASERDTVVVLEKTRYLGQKPLMQLKDSTGHARNYFQDRIYDDDAFGKAVKYVNMAAARDNMRLDIVIAKANALADYEKGSPDMALNYLLGIVDLNFTKKYKWEYPGSTVDAEFFDSVIQDFCVRFYQCGEKASWEAFRLLSERMLKYEPKNNNFIDNIGAYWLVAAEKPKTARKFYQKSLKLKPDDAVAKSNLEIIGKRLSAGKSRKK